MRLGLAVSTVALLAAACSDSKFGASPTVPFVPSAARGTDDRTPITAPTSPPPISGGTLLVTHDGRFAVAADPDRDRVSVVALRDRILTQSVALTPGDEPGRVVEDAYGMIHVALRRGGAVATIDPDQGTVLRRTAVCGAPRGIAYESITKLVHVACAGGELVSLPAFGGDAVRRLALGPDLRDVVVTPAGLVVSRFKSASLITIDPDGKVVHDVAPQRIGRTSQFFDPSSGQAPQVGMDPAVAWRTVAAPSGDVIVLHQYGLAAPIDIGTHDGSSGDKAIVGPESGSYGSPIGSPPGCGGLVSPGVSTLGFDNRLLMGAQISGGVLTVDLSTSPDGTAVALAHAGQRDPATFGLSNQFEGPGIVDTSTGGSVSVMSISATGGLDPATDNCVFPETTIPIPGQPTAVAFNPNEEPYGTPQPTWLVVQTREPAQLVVIRDQASQQQWTVNLGGPSMLDTGHEIFHRDAGAGIACAECHAEGGEDGRVWKFSPTGERRTQALHVGLAGTEPFHWDGDMTDLSILMDEVFVRRMGGPNETPDRKAALRNWISGLKPPAAMRDATSPEAVQGKTLFESAEVGCSSCHSGEKHTNNRTVFVGTTEANHPVQVPSLVGIGYRAPFLHDGCAATLRNRFDANCGGGNLHGNTSGLTEEQLGNLIAYLETL
jgi:hypothetical protein